MNNLRKTRVHSSPFKILTKYFVFFHVFPRTLQGFVGYSFRILPEHFVEFYE